MNPTLQAELHPDADSLNAFAEHALAGNECERVVAHLATCGSCRQVVYLAQEAAETAATAEVPGMRVLPWIRHWRLLWASAAALAAALTVAVVVHSRHTSSIPEMAKAAPEIQKITPRPPAPEAVRPPAPAASAKRDPAAKLASEKSVAPAMGALASAPASAAAPSDSLTFQPAAPGLTFAEGSAVPRPSGSPAGTPVPRGTKVLFKPQPAVTAWQQEQLAGAYQAKAESALAAKKSTRAAVDNTHTSRSLAVAAAMPRSAAPLPAAGGFQPVLGSTMVPAPNSRERGSIKLPSGLAAASTAMVQRRVLAIDAAGALFLSEDGGENWKPIARQWTGRAIEVRVQRGLSLNSAPAEIMELTNDGGLVWVSTDGMIWTMQ